MVAPRRTAPKQTAHAPDSIVSVPLDTLTPARLNDQIYKPVRDDDPEIRVLADNIRQYGVLDPIVVTADGVILSGHRRHAAAGVAGLTHVPARRHPIRSDDPAFAALLVSFNAARDKDPAERVREQLALTDPEEAYRAVVSQRVEAARVRVEAVPLSARRPRSKISAARKPMLDAITNVLDDLDGHWPLSDRRVHYALLNEPPLMHAAKPASRYGNNQKCYKVICTVLTQARLEGKIPFAAIGDETRPVTTWDVFPHVGPFVRQEVDGFLTGYARDLQRGQPCHLEILGEKLTVEGTIKPVASEFCIPYTIGRGYSSLPPRKALADRFAASGKSRLVVLVLSDHDPEGADIPASFAKSLRDDFGIADVTAVKVGLTHAQVTSLNLPPNTEAKTSSSRYRAFAAKYGKYAYELEAVPPDLLRQWLREQITAVLDVDAFNAQVAAEKRDTHELAARKRAAADYLMRLNANPEGPTR